jgi:hypothetical protein
VLDSRLQQFPLSDLHADQLFDLAAESEKATDGSKAAADD